MNDPRVSELIQGLATGSLSRRQFVHRALGLGLSATAVSGLLARGASAAPAPQPRAAARYQTDATTLVIADNLADRWVTLDPAIIYEINSQAAMNVVYETLYHLPDSTKPDQFEPLLATELPEFSADGLQVTIKLRQGVTFHTTGNPMTSADWIFSWNRLKNQQENPSFLSAYLGAYTAADEYTINLALDAPNAALVAILGSTPLSVADSKAIQAAGGTDTETKESDDVRTKIREASYGTGPYLLSKWDINTEVIIEKNASYWGEAAQLDRIIWRHEPDANTELQLVQTGEADIAYYLDPDSASTVESDDNLQLISGPTLNVGYLALHTSEETGGPLANKGLRQAIGYAIDYDALRDGLSGGASVKPATMIPIPLLGSEDVQSLGYTKDLTKAQELFDATGTGAVELTLTYASDEASPTGVAYSTYMAKIKDDLEQINGLTITLEPMPGDQRLQAYREGKLQFTVSDWPPDYPDVQAMAEPFAKTGGAAAKRVAYSDPAVDALLDQGIAELDPAKRLPIYVDIQKAMIEAAAFLPLEQPVDRKPASKAVQGVATHSIYLIQLRYASKTA